MTKRLDLTGQVFGALTALEPIGSDQNSHVVWRFQCECGAIVERVGTETVQRIKKGWQPSCGRFQCAQYRRLEDGESAINTRLYIYRSGAKKRGIVFDLTREEAVHLFQQNCYYCGAEPSHVTRHPRSRSKAFVHNGIDRIDNTQGYIPGNVVPCCTQCNRAKGTLTHDEFIAWLRRAAVHQFGVAV
jgi:hypothetical protein